MNVNTFFEARELYDKYCLCETVLEYLSDEDKPQGQKFLETLKTFVNVFQGDFMMFVHNKMIEVGEQFESIHCPEHSDSGLVPPPLPDVPKEPVFPIGSTVEIVGGDHNGEVGTVHNYESGQYYVVSPQFSMWFAEVELKAYVDESEEPEEPTPPTEVPPFPEDAKFQLGNRVVVNGNVGTIAGYDFIDHKYAVLLDSDDEEPIWADESEIEKYEDNG